MTPRQVSKGPCQPPRRRPTPPPEPEGPNERAIREGVDWMTATLANQDDSTRPAAVRHAVTTLIPAALARVVDRLGDLLDASHEPNRRRVLATLAEFGPHAVPPLTLRLMRARDADSQRGAAEALRMIAPRLDERGRIDLMTEVMALTPLARDASVRHGIAEVMAALRRADDGRPAKQ